MEAKLILDPKFKDHPDVEYLIITPNGHHYTYIFKEKHRTTLSVANAAVDVTVEMAEKSLAIDLDNRIAQIAREIADRQETLNQLTPDLVATVRNIQLVRANT